MAVQEIKNNFEETVLKAKGPVIVDFWAHGAVIADAFPRRLNACRKNMVRRLRW